MPVTAAKQKLKVLTPVFRVAFPSVFEKERPMEGATREPEYSITMLFDKEYLKKNSAELQRFNDIKKLVNDACVDKFKKPLKEMAAKIPNFRDPIRDGAEKEHLEGFGEGVIYMRAKTKRRPRVIDSSNNPIEDPEMIYGGCYCRASLGVFAYDNRTKGVRLNLNNIMFVKDGARFDGVSDPSDDFGEFVEAGTDAADDDLM